ncbi:MAG: S1C family serine protease, partial [Candidatus Aminicenantales bacterium]
MRSKVPGLTSVLLISSFSAGFAVQDLLTSLEKEVTKLIEQAKPAVVSISSKSFREYVIVKDSGLMSLFGEKREKRTVTYKNVGSGIIISEAGYIITKGSVVRGLEDIEVTLVDGREFPAELIDIDEATDIAVIRIDGDNLVPAKLGNSDAIEAGSWIVIIGNSLGLSPAVSFGLVNGIREDGMIHVSATISPGNSGCPIFDTKGEVVGIITARINAGDPLYWPGFCEGGLAFPVNKIKKIADSIIKKGKIRKGWLGVTIDHFREAGQDTVPHITQIIPNGPAQRAGLRKGDVIIQYNGKDIH